MKSLNGPASIGLKLSTRDDFGPNPYSAMQRWGRAKYLRFHKLERCSRFPKDLKAISKPRLLPMDDEPELIPPSPKKQANYQVGDCVLAKSTVNKFMVNFTMGIIKGAFPFDSSNSQISRKR